MTDRIILTRTPPAHIRRLLRQEVNFGCPIQGCGVPYLTYHHFDPPWREKKHHNPKGIIALCPNHAARADGEAYTKNQLKGFKNYPYITSNQISDNFSFLRQDLVLMIGCLAYGFKNFINISNETILGVGKTPQGYLAINMLFRDNAGNKLLEMKENDWTLYIAEVFDFECPPRGKNFRIRAKDNKTDLFVRFDDFLPQEFKEKMVSLGYKPEHVDNLLQRIDRPKKVYVLKILGTIQTNNFDLNLTEVEIRAESKNVHFSLKNYSFISEQRDSLFSFNQNGTVEIG